MKIVNLVVSCILLITACSYDNNKRNNPKNSFTDSVYKSWMKRDAGNLTFRYPHEWSFKQKKFGTGKQYGVNPPGFEDLESYFAFEILEFPTEGRPFKEFQNAAFNSYYKRTDNHVEVISKEHIKFDGLDADLVQLTIYNDSSELINYISMYIINGVKKFYSISVTRDIAGNKIKLDDILNMILKSVRISR